MNAVRVTLLSPPRRDQAHMSDRTSPSASELSEEMSEVLARGRELVKQAQQTANGAGQQAEQAQATMAETDRALDEAQQLINEIE